MKRMRIVLMAFVIVVVCIPAIASESDSDFVKRGAVDFDKMKVLTLQAEQRQNDFANYDSMYASWSHLVFGIWGHKRFSVPADGALTANGAGLDIDRAKTIEKSIIEKWWGEEVVLDRIIDDAATRTDAKLRDRLREISRECMEEADRELSGEIEKLKGGWQ